ncbi:MAG: ATP-binding protein [Sphingobacteriales bacterium 17-39-43]|jgi:serine/threonine-protein kinase RsbW|uniref:ATP-binding protein n=1 Tax=Daejeonella sp. TaxID=2805397 RepID=UPI000BD9E5B0|nr:ATP-binding protein [Daejeonella sp.]MCF8451995.1 ATP-binding protein [Pedobacter sp.]OYZ32261.1 MAG: ATP-binding protein [Sphingobacteriales bacterium 16-39-50]OYZ47260.1 MAG: ATP-binding protein [Sphingobacteriales bacterium 24-40-4]OZA25606.1 MAG: ATP-binding protein [Sphingobacteriales bacterium 17-39-43]HQS06539.1 ATP-binding protein [Daejeonella sp.]
MSKQTEFSDNTSLYTLQLPSRIDSITIVENFIDELSAKYGFSDELYANVLTCLSEAVINAIVHGNRESLEKKVYINLEVIEDKRLIFTISDEGDGFDFNNLPDPTAPENIENLTGRGVFIIKKLADQCIFNSKGNELELHFKI